jgi:hypothetical protein
MDPMSKLRRVRDLLWRPSREWPRIAAEDARATSLYRGWILWLAALPPLFGFVKGALIGYGAAGGVLRLDLAHAVVHAVLAYGVGVGLVAALAFVVDALARGFGAAPNPRRATQLVAYALTAYWVAGVFAIVPVVSLPLTLLAWFYVAYLLRLGLPLLLGCPPEKAGAYAATVGFIAFVLWLAGGAIARVLAGVNAALSGPNTFVS